MTFNNNTVAYSPDTTYPILLKGSFEVSEVDGLQLAIGPVQTNVTAELDHLVLL